MPHDRDRFIRFVEKHKPLLWVGAGVSIQAGHPSTWKLAEELWKSAAFTDKPGADDPYTLIQAFFEEECSGKRGPFDKALNKLIPGHLPLSDLHNSIGKLAGELSWADIVTTNYDNLMERALADNHVPHLPHVLDKADHIPNDGNVRLMLIHGSSKDWASTILLPNSYDTYTTTYPRLLQHLSTLMRQHSILFVGCSMLDERVLGWIDEQDDAALGRLHHWVALMTAKDEELLHSTIRPNGQTAQSTLEKVGLRILTLPDHNALPAWFKELEGTVVGASTTPPPASVAPPAPPVAPSTPTPAPDMRQQTIDALLKLNPAQFQLLCSFLNAPSSVLPPNTVALVTRIIALIDYIQGQDGSLDRIWDTLPHKMLFGPNAPTRPV